MDAERAVLGGLLLDSEKLDEVMGVLEPGQFYSFAHREIFDTMLDMHRAQERVDVVLLNERMKQRGTLEKVGGTAYLAEITESVPTAANVSYYANAVRALWLSREMVVVGAKIQQLGYSAGAPVAERMEDAEQLLFGLTSQGIEKLVTHTPRDLMSMVFERIKRLSEGDPPGVRTGLGSLDDVLRGMQPGELTLLAGRPSMGKTALACHLLRRMARAGQSVGLVSIETPSEQLGINWLASRVRIDSRNLRDGFIPKDTPQRLLEGMEQIAELDPYWRCCDRGVKTVMDLRRIARLWKAKHKIKVLAVDYLQLLRGSKDSRRQGRYQEVTDVSIECKQIARDFDLHWIALCQLNRKSEDRTGNEPRISDLRDSGQLEQDADVIMLIHRPGYYNENENAEDTTLIVGKNRNGGTGRVQLRFVREHNRFEETGADAPPGAPPVPAHGSPPRRRIEGAARVDPMRPYTSQHPRGHFGGPGSAHD